MRPARCPGDAPALIVAVAARATLLTALLLALWAVVAAVAGAEVTTVVSDSMAPSIRAGDVVAVVPAGPDGPAPGQVLLVDDPDRTDRLRMHRLHAVEPDGLRLQGDANPGPDSSLVQAAAVHGVGVLRFPFVGLPGLWLRTGDWTPLLATTAVAAALVALAGTDRGIRSGAACRRCGAPRSAALPPSSSRARRALPAVAATATAVTAALVVVATAAGATFSGLDASASSLRTGAFACFRTQAVDDAVLAWDFDEPRGDVVDRSGNGNAGALLDGARRIDAACTDDPRMTFSGESARVVDRTPGSAPATFTMEAWVRTTTPRGHVLGFSSDRGAASPIKSRVLYLDAAGKARFGVQGTNNGFKFQVASTAGVADGAWHHLVGTFSPGRLELWVDGSAQASRSDNPAAETAAGYWRVGRQSLAGWGGASVPYDFAGEVDHVRIYERVLTADEIRAHSSAGR